MARHWALGMMAVGLLGFVASCGSFSPPHETPAHTMYAFPPVDGPVQRAKYDMDAQLSSETGTRTAVQAVAIGDSVTIVTLAAGADKGIKPDFAFVIYRGDEYLGKVRIVGVAKTTSTGVVVEQRSQIRAGDVAISSR